MAIFINTNIAALNAQRNLGITGLKMSKALEKRSSGLRINRAADDAAGLSISEGWRGRVRGLRRGARLRAGTGGPRGRPPHGPWRRTIGGGHGTGTHPAGKCGFFTDALS